MNELETREIQIEHILHEMLLKEKLKSGLDNMLSQRECDDIVYIYFIHDRNGCNNLLTLMTL